MNTLILNRESFKIPDDGWYQLAPLGEFPHAAAGVIQVVDAESCVAMVARFKADAAVPNFAGLLVDFDHFSLSAENRSEAAGWIVGLEARGISDGTDGSDASRRANAGLWAKIRWSDVGEEAVKGGRYRFLSPVWARSDCVDLGPSTGSAGSPQAGSGQAMARVRPVRLLNAAVTNEPNLKGLVALSNSSQESSACAEATADRESRIQNGDPVDRSASIEGTVEEPAFARSTGATARRSAEGGSERMAMKRVIEKLMNHLGLPGDASEDVILEKMQGLPAMTAVAELQNSLKQAKDECDALRTELKGAEDEIVNRHLAEFEGVVTEKTKTFWTEQLMGNRAGALAALNDLVEVAQRAKGTEHGKEPTPSPSKEGSRKPLHNRATARPVIPGVNGTAENPSTGSGLAAARIRNRAHEIVKSEKVPFSVAFRRAEKELI